MITPSLDDTLRSIRLFVGRGQATAALELARKAQNTHPNEPRLWHALAATYASMGNLDQAALSIERALSLAGNDAPLLILCGQLLASIGHRKEARSAALSAERLSPSTPVLRDALGSLFTLCDDPKRAYESFRAAASAEPGNARYLYNLATAERMIGEFAAAEKTLDDVLRIEPENALAHLMRSDLRRQTQKRNHLPELARLVEAPSVRGHDRIMLGYALAKELEDIGDFRRSFEYLQRASSAHRATFAYDVQDDIVTINEIICRHKPDAFRCPAGSSNKKPIFVMGLPRTGTTLLERIISSHPTVRGAGELQAFPTAAVKAVQKIKGVRVSKQEFVDLALGLDGSALGNSYLESADELSLDRPYFVDKQPLNYLYAALIHHALPEAPLIIVMRDPMDACFAMYRTLFIGAYPFSYRQDELATYYLAWTRLVAHWKAVLGKSVLVVAYEDLVRSTDSTVRAVLQHCGLPWDERCLRFYENRQAATSASAVSVRQPMFASSIGRWRNFELELAPLKEALLTTADLASNKP